MTAPPYVLTELTLSGFRAYLKPKTFDLSRKQSMVVFAPNGKGKSSIADALEFFFSDDGTLERIGIRTINNKAGVIALAHNRAEQQRIESCVIATFSRGNVAATGKRPTSGERLRPDIASEVKTQFVVDPIIRGNSLRQFVEQRTAEQRYEDVARWLELGAYVDVQTKLRELRRKVKASVEDEQLRRSFEVQLGRKTAGLLTAWDDPKVLAHINNLLAVLDEKLVAVRIDPVDPALQLLKQRAAVEAKQIGLVGLRQIRLAATALFNAESDESLPAGLILEVENAANELTAAEEIEVRERAAAANAIFDQVWKNAELLFAEDQPPIDTCPVCATPIADTVAGSVEGIRSHLAGHINELRQYASAKKVRDDAASKFLNQKTQLLNAINALVALLSEDDATLIAAAKGYATAVQSWTRDPPERADLTSQLVSLSGQLAISIAHLEAEQGNHTYTNTQAVVAALLELKFEYDAAARRQAKLRVLYDELQIQSQYVAAAIRGKVQTVLDSLEAPMNQIYREIQRESAVPIRLHLPAEEDTNQQRLNLVVDFADNREGVQPVGYLSDSQIHSVALSLRLAAIKRCNVGAPFVVLDDVVTSYDADHRLALASLLAKEFAGLQLIVVTHDERFFLYLRDHLGDPNFQYARILALEPNSGPRFADERVSDQMIEDKWANGQSAANDIRQAEEEWLLAVCRDFGVDVRIRTVERAYSYERSELASALASFLKARGLTPPPVPGVNNRFLVSLQSGVVENFGSHFQDAQYGALSTGDEKVRWSEFVYFRDQFVCSHCGKKRFKRPNVGVNKPICAAESCETPFAFGAPAAPFPSRVDSEASPRSIVG